MFINIRIGGRHSVSPNIFLETTCRGALELKMPADADIQIVRRVAAGKKYLRRIEKWEFQKDCPLLEQ